MSDDGDGESWVQSFLFNRCLTIAGGTTDIQKNVIAERLLGLALRLTREATETQNRRSPVPSDRVQQGTTDGENTVFFEDVAEGDAGPALSHELTRTDLVMYAGVRATSTRCTPTR